jgi:hypothetical protein
LEKKTDFIQSFNTAGVRVVSVHCIDCIRLIVDGLFVIVISVIAVCCVAEFVVNVDDIDVKKRLISNDDNKPKKKTQRVESKAKEPKLAAYNIDWFDSTSTQNKCLNHTLSTNLPSTQEEQPTFLLTKYQASDIKTAFADAIGKVGRAARKVFYPLPLCKEKLISNFLELIYNGKSIMVDNSKDSFR